MNISIIHVICQVTPVHREREHSKFTQVTVAVVAGAQVHQRVLSVSFKAFKYSGGDENILRERSSTPLP